MDHGVHDRRRLFCVGKFHRDPDQMGAGHDLDRQCVSDLSDRVIIAFRCAQIGDLWACHGRVQNAVRIDQGDLRHEVRFELLGSRRLDVRRVEEVDPNRRNLQNAGRLVRWFDEKIDEISNGD